MKPRRIAWFSPFPPVRTGISACSAELVAALRARGHVIDAYPTEAAHDFPWRHRQRPYDLVVYQFGNSSHHDYEWAYALRYPGLVVLHDTHLHHARAAFLLREKRAADYRAEFTWSHPDVSPDAAELGIAGFDSHLYYEWPMVRALVETARLVATHSRISPFVESPIPPFPDLQIPDRAVSIRLGHGELVTPQRAAEARVRVRGRYRIADDAVVFVCAGGLTPEKRIPQILDAFADLLRYAPSAHLLLAGAPASHYDVYADVIAHDLQDRVTITGYIERDADLTDHLAASDVSLNLRWPTTGEISGPWLRALAAGVATVITDLVHLGSVPTLDPRTWTENRRWPSGFALWDEGSASESSGPEPKGESPKLEAHTPKPKAQGPKPIAVAIDILDEDHSLRLAMRRLATDPELRQRLARAGQMYWQREHTLDAMVADYERIIARAAEQPDPVVTLPAHLRDDGDRRLRELIQPFGVQLDF